MAANSRDAAAGIVERWLLTKDFPDRLIPPDIPDRPFVMEVVYGVTKWRRLLEWVVDQFVQRTPDENVMSFLLVGIYQLLIMDTVADHAAIYETVEAAKGRGCPAGFVNGVLRSVLRKREAIKRDASELSPAIATSHPDILIRRWTPTHGIIATRELCDWNNERARVTISPNPLKTTHEKLLLELRNAGIEALPHPYCPEASIIIPRGIRVTKIPGYEEGHFTVQDASTHMAIGLLNALPGEHILDACAAPGGKTTLIAWQMRDEGRVVAMDLHKDRLPRLAENVERMGLNSVEILCGDASREEDLRSAAGNELFDRILLDMPCSNTGVLQRRPDARWRFSEGRLKGLARTQAKILDAVARVLAPGGTIVYSTCSLEPEENGQLVKSWLKKNRSFRLLEKKQLFPPESRTDGAFAAALKKQEQ
ncbi:MAG: 16S rRNA (cytosine(967)-C(5))-methyltransferase RsmB [Kiritimatiellia bacterium]|jgi:16S rRNA (cytosine967-C5)-methyltransferase|nr:16S rRNA (cytosine(967)-C(5))-methyltransferase RsmB [Kiritimatiellia bacterium]MDP6848599.1 16S rRNA (cytosine(967)-C(5))-methyltransferase RsmB [Kiritimatiellia bacterium]